MLRSVCVASAVKRTLVASTTLTLFLPVHSTFAQGRSAAQVLPELIANATVIRAPENANDPDHEFHFSTAPALTSVPAALNAAIALQVSDMSMGPVSSGQIFSRDGSPEGARRTFGTSYGARGFSLGKGTVGLGITFQNTNFSTLDDADIRGGGINFLFGHTDCCPPGLTDVLQETVYVRVNRKVTAFVLDYGATSRFDIGIVAPIVQVNMAGRVASRILRVSTAQDPSTHAFDPLFRATHTTYLDVNLDRATGTNFGVDGKLARGIGDIILRGKFAFVQTESTGLSAIVNLSLPTGDADNFLGTGSLRVKPTIAWSSVIGRVSPHASGAYTFSNGDSSSALQDAYPSQRLDLRVPDEIEWTAGIDAAIAPRATLIAEAVGRRVRDVQRFAVGQTIFATGAPGGPAQDVAAGTDLITNGRGDLNQTFATLGGRFNLGGSVFANASVFIPVSVDGLKPNASAAFTFNYGF